MKNHLSKYYPSYLLFSILFFFLILINYVVWGQDGINLWMPILSEFLKHPDTYPWSHVIFAGQNLREIYGDLMLWKFLSFFTSSPLIVLNLTYYFFVFLFYVLILNIHNQITRKTNYFSQVLLFLFCSFSPMILNRLYAGHLNLLFPVLPFFGLTLFLLMPTWLNALLLMLTISASLSIISYQVLAYYPFYFFIFYFFMTENNIDLKEKFLQKDFLIKFSSAIAVGFIISLPQFLSMFSHAFGPNQLRSINANVVYSYTVSDLSDFPLLFYSTFSSLFHKNIGFFHELSYPLSLSLILLFIRDYRYKKTVYALTVTIFLVFLFSANIFPLHYLAELPLIKAFRVPQRAFMIPNMFLGFLFLSHFIEKLNLKSFLLSFVFLIVLSFASHYEVYILPLFFLALLFNEYKPNLTLSDFLIPLVIAAYFMGSPEKLILIKQDNIVFNDTVKYVQKISDHYKLGAKDSIVHFETKFISPLSLSVAANYIGLRTVEGYGHPPVPYVLKMESIINTKLSNTINLFYFNQEVPGFDEIVKQFKITDMIEIDANNGIHHREFNVAN